MFSEKLKEIRQSRGLSQVKLASILGVTQSAVANWERGSRIPDLDTLLRISNEFQLSLDSLLEKKDDSHRVLFSSLPNICGFSDSMPVFSDDRPVLPASDAIFTARDDSMAGDGIHTGSHVLIKFSDVISSGDIALIYTDGTLVLRRVYSEKDKMILMSENKNYAPAVFFGEECNNLRIIGKAVGIVSSI